MQLNTHISTNFKSCFQWINSTLVLVNLSIKTPKWNINTVHCVRKHAHQLSHTQRWLLFKELVVLDKRRSEVSCGLIWLRHFSSPFARRTVTSPNLYSTGKWYIKPERYSKTQINHYGTYTVTVIWEYNLRYDLQVFVT